MPAKFELMFLLFQDLLSQLDQNGQADGLHSKLTALSEMIFEFMEDSTNEVS